MLDYTDEYSRTIAGGSIRSINDLNLVEFDSNDFRRCVNGFFKLSYKARITPIKTRMKSARPRLFANMKSFKMVVEFSSLGKLNGLFKSIAKPK